MTHFQKEFRRHYEENITRAGAKEFLEFLDSSDFFSAPASIRFHNAFEGGLVQHSLNVYLILLRNNELYEDIRYGDTAREEYSEETLAICGLLHDVCKINCYEEDDSKASNAQMTFFDSLCMDKGIDPSVVEGRSSKGYLTKAIDSLKKGLPLPLYSPSYKYYDHFPIGHGEKSVILLQRYMSLSEEESLAIRWHLGGFDPGVNYFFPSGEAHKEATKRVPLVSMLFTADYLTSYLVDRWDS